MKRTTGHAGQTAVWLVLVGVSASCSGPKAVERPSPGAVSTARCFQSLPGTRIEMDHSGDTVVLNYTIAENDVGRLRRTLGDFAEQQNRIRPSRQSGTAGALPAPPPGTSVLLPSVHAQEVDVPSGAQLWLSPVFPADRELLRRDLQQAAPASARCPASQVLTPTVPGI